LSENAKESKERDFAVASVELYHLLWFGEAEIVSLENRDVKREEEVDFSIFLLLINHRFSVTD
jgi:hypothetical protein